jgi:hypothetical protein
MNLSGLKCAGSFHEKADTRPVFAYFMQFDSFSSEGRLSDAVSDLHYLLQEEDLCLANYEQLLYSLSETDALWLYHRHADLIIEWMDAKTSIFTLVTARLKSWSRPTRFVGSWSTVGPQTYCGVIFDVRFNETRNRLMF